MRRFPSGISSFPLSVAASLAVFVSVAAGCSGKAALVGEGGECQLATDCQSGLICIPQKNGTSVCSNNLNSVQMLPPTPDAAIPPLPDASAGGGDDAAAPGSDSGSSAKSEDAGKGD